MRDHDARKRSRPQRLFKPRNPGQVQVVGRLVEQQHIRPAHHGLGNREPLAPAARKCSCLRRCLRKADPSTGLAQLAFALGFGHVAGNQRALQHIAHRQPGSKRRLLPDIADARPLAFRHLTGIRILFLGQNFQQRRLAGSVRPNEANAVAV